MTKKKSKLMNHDKWLLAIAVFALVGGVWYIGCGDEGDTTPTNETMSMAQLMAMMPMTTSPYSSCDQLDMVLLRSYDDYSLGGEMDIYGQPQHNGYIDQSEALVAIGAVNRGDITWDEVNQIVYAYVHKCPVDKPTSSYLLYGIIAIIIIGGAVLYARRKNIGGK